MAGTSCGDALKGFAFHWLIQEGGGKMMLDLIKKTMKKMNLATREDMLRLSKRMKKLEQALKEKGQRG